MISRAHFPLPVVAIVVAMAMLPVGCEKMFDVHPYDVQIDGPAGLNATNIALIEEQCADKDTLRVAFISDSHQWYADARDIADDINRRPDVDFVIHCGDITNKGARKEFLWFRDRVYDRIAKPCVTLIGNHDYLGTGDQAYRILLGNPDFSLVAGGVKFLCLNTNATEYDYVAPVPNFEFIEQEAQPGTRPFGRTVVVMHAPPYSEQFNNNVARPFRAAIDSLPGLLCCVYGHNHETAERHPFADSLTFYGVASAQKRQYRIFTFTPDGYEVEVVSL